MMRGRRVLRYVIRDVRTTQHTALTGKIREPWQVIDTLNQSIVDELSSKRAAQATAAAFNKGER